MSGKSRGSGRIGGCPGPSKITRIKRKGIRMTVHEVYAQIWEGKVQNIIVCDNYEMANYLSRMSYGEEGFAVECSRYACTLGDFYHDGAFWRRDPETGEESEVKRIPTSEEQVAKLEAENAVLQQQVTDTQLALCEVYELMG